MLIKDYSGKEINADVIYALATSKGIDYISLTDEALVEYARYIEQPYPMVKASVTMVNITD